MAGTSEEALDVLKVKILKREKISKEQSIELYDRLLRTIIKNNVKGGEGWAISMTITGYIKELDGTRV